MTGHFLGISRMVLGLFLAIQSHVSPAQPAPSSWQAQIQTEDRSRLAGLWRAWTRSIADIAAAAALPRLQALGAVGVPPVEPLPGRREETAPAMLPGVGGYECRIIRMGLRDDGWPRDDANPLALEGWEPCRMTPGAAGKRGGTLGFAILDGEQRLTGDLWADGDRMVFLGALGLASEPGTRRYGDDPDRDMLGVLRPLEAGHWRLELPWPRWQSNLMLIEIRSL